MTEARPADGAPVATTPDEPGAPIRSAGVGAPTERMRAAWILTFSLAVTGMFVGWYGPLWGASAGGKARQSVWCRRAGACVAGTNRWPAASHMWIGASSVRRSRISSPRMTVWAVPPLPLYRQDVDVVPLYLGVAGHQG